MTRRQLLYVNTLSAIALLLIVEVWVSSYYSQVYVAWTAVENHNQVVSYNGSLHFITNRSWWRHEDLAIRINLISGDSPIISWPGMQIDSQFVTPGFSIAEGNWTSHYIQTNEATRFTSEQRRVPPGTMLRTTTPITVWAVSYWPIAAGLLTCLAIGVTRWLKERVSTE